MKKENCSTSSSKQKMLSKRADSIRAISRPIKRKFYSAISFSTRNTGACDSFMDTRGCASPPWQSVNRPTMGKYKRFIVLSPSVERLSTWERQTRIGTDIDSIAAGQIIATIPLHEPPLAWSACIM